MDKILRTCVYLHFLDVMVLFRVFEKHFVCWRDGAQDAEDGQGYGGQSDVGGESRLCAEER